ncbi:MAG: DUF1697 domain-containing protein [Hyphomonas sp.]|uniref:DUF1697 domain-containing protein n=1 Tax=Hyphomonas sp. TaxID=87 RepID=UPI003528FC3D
MRAKTPARYAAFLRAVNVGGTGKLAMSDLKDMCAALGFEGVKTYIASGNVVFRSAASEADVKQALEARLEAYAGKPVGVIVRTAEELADVLARNPFPDAAPNRTVAMLTDAPANARLIAAIKGITDEDIRPGKRELFIHFPNGQADSKIRYPADFTGTGRNMNTIAKLAELAAAL